MAENRGLKTRVPISSTVKTELYKWLKSYSEETSIPISKLLDKSIESFQKSTTPTKCIPAQKDDLLE